MKTVRCSLIVLALAGISSAQGASTPVAIQINTIYAGADGKFELTTFIAKDGAPTGEYKVMIRWPATAKSAATNEDPERASGGFDRLNGKYLNPEQSGLTAKVGDGPTDVPPFALKSK